MQTLKYLLITLLCTGVLGAVAGIVIGKYFVKKKKYSGKPLLQKKERYIYLGCVALGVIFICFGLFFRFPSSQIAAVDGAAVLDGAAARNSATFGGGNTIQGSTATASASARDDVIVEESNTAEDGETDERDGEVERDGETTGNGESAADSESSAESKSSESSGSSSSRILPGDLLRRNQSSSAS